MKTRHTIATFTLVTALGVPVGAAAESGAPPYGWDLARDTEWLGLQVDRVHVGGWLDASYRDSNLHGDGSNLAVNHLNGFLDLRFAERWQLFFESEIEYNPEVEGIERESEVELEQAYLDYSVSDAFEARIGRFSTPFGYWTPVHWSINTDTVIPPLHEVRRYVPEQQVGARIHGSLFPRLADRDLQLDYSLFGGYASDQLGNERAQGPTLGTDLRLSDDRFGFAGVSLYTQKADVPGPDSRTRETNGMLYGELRVPGNLTLRGEYLTQRRGGRFAASRYRHAGYAKIRWDFRKMYANYRFERADDEDFGSDAIHDVHRVTLGYSPRPRVRLRAEFADHVLRESLTDDFQSWTLWLGVFF